MILIRGETAAEITLSSSTACVKSFVVHISPSRMVSQTAQNMRQDSESQTTIFQFINIDNPHMEIIGKASRWRIAHLQL